MTTDELVRRYRKGAEVIQRDADTLQHLINQDDPAIVHLTGGLAFYVGVVSKLARLLALRADDLEGRSVDAPLVSSAARDREVRKLRSARTKRGRVGNGLEN